MKTKALFLSLFLVVAFSFAAGCGNKQGANNQTTQNNQPKQTTPAESTPDVKTTASIVNEAGAFEKAISRTGTWIIAITQDLTVNKDLVLDGEFKNGKKDKDGKDIIQRKIALYAQDENRNITARYTLTAPKMTINSPYASIQHGTFKGDLYVSASNFQLIDATVQGNVYFLTDDAKATFKPDEKSKVTGTQEMKKP